MYLDSKGLIVQQGGDGGDTLQREGFWYEGVFLVNAQQTIPGLATYQSALALLDTPGGFVRSWQTPYNDPPDTSRDQLVSNVRACGYYGFAQGPYLRYLRSIFHGVINNYSRFPNGDFAFVNDYGRFIRAFRLWYLWPILLLCDLPIIVNSVIRCVAGRDPNNVGDDVNHIGDLAQCQRTYPTPVSWIARKIYKWFRPQGPQYALDWYFRVESGGNPEFAALWAPIVKGF